MRPLRTQRSPDVRVLALAMAGTLLVFLLVVRPVMNEGFRYQWPALYWLAFGAIPAAEETKRSSKRPCGMP